MASGPRAEPAKVEDADDDGNAIDGSYYYARSNAAPSVPGSPKKKEEPNTGKKAQKRGDSPSNIFNDSDSTAHPSPPRSAKSKPKQPERRRSISSKKAMVVGEPRRPAPRSSKTTPAPPSSRNSNESSYYGVTHQTVSTSRPRAHSTRPNSYYGQTRPPLSHSAYYHGPPPQALPPPSYPPPSWGSGPHIMAPSPIATHPPVDHFSGRQDNLAARFGGRPQSSMGFHTGYDDYEQEQGLVRRPSLSRRHKEQEDRARMPPPARPVSVRPERLVLRAAPTRKRVEFDSDDLDGDSNLYTPAPAGRRTSFEYETVTVPSRSSRRFSSTEYEQGDYTVEPVPRSRSRRDSYYVGYEDKVKEATRYQNDVAGGPTAPLTAESLRAVKSGSSRSTRSSASRDESSYKQSATTRTTRSGTDDDITIRFSGGVVQVGDTAIKCSKGGEITIPRGAGSSRAGSDRATTVFDDDRKSRGDKVPNRTRTHSRSQTGSFPRPPPPEMYAPQHYGQYVEQYIPPPPVYPHDPHNAPDYGEHYYSHPYAQHPLGRSPGGGGFI